VSPALGLTWPSRMQSLGSEELAYVEMVRRALKRFGDRAGEDIQNALHAVRDASHFNVEVPTDSTRREVALVKTGVKKLLAWYMRFLSAQLDSFGSRVVRMSETLVARTDRLESRADDMEAHVAVLDKRVRELEEGTSAHADSSPGPAADARPAGTSAKTAAKPRRPRAD
jgi:hypothetical protein